jgi:PAS domain S-box-containing protein
MRPEDLGIGRLFDAIRDAVIIAKADTRQIILWNPAAGEIFGYSPDEALKLRVEALIPNYLKAAHRAGINRYSKTGPGPYIDSRAVLEMPALTKGGKEIVVELSLSPLRAVPERSLDDKRFVLIIARDITARKRAEQEMHSSETQLRALFSAMSDVILELDRDGRYLNVAPTNPSLLYKPSEDLLGKSIHEVFPKALADEFLGHIRHTLRTRHTVSAEYSLPIDGRKVWFSASIAPMTEETVIWVARDITERKQAGEIYRQRNFYEALLKAQSDLGEGLIIVEGEHIIYANEAFLKISGYTLQELKVLPSCFELLVKEEKDLFAKALRHQLIESTTTVDNYETILLHKNGKRVDLQCAAKALERDEEGGRTNKLLVLAHEITQRKQAQRKLKHSLEALLALHQAGQILISSLDPDEIGSRLLKIMQRVFGLRAGVIKLRDEHQRLRIEHTIGPKSLWRGAQNTLKAKEARQAALRIKEPQLFHLASSDSGSSPLAGLYLPLWVREKVVGLLEIYGPQSLAEDETVKLFEDLCAQGASALENARLYRELAERERRLVSLVGSLFSAREEERRRVAYEVHNSLAQFAAAAHQHLQASLNYYPPSSPQARHELEQALNLVKQTVTEARRIIAKLRPTVLDDFGLASAIRVQAEQLGAEGWEIYYEETLEGERLPPAVETTLFHVAQEALTNIRKHAQAKTVRIKLTRLGEKIRLRVRDYGRGFELSALTDANTLGEMVGLSGMREQVALLNGKFKIQSRPGAGTLIVADIPLSLPTDTAP